VPHFLKWLLAHASPLFVPGLPICVLCPPWHSCNNQGLLTPVVSLIPSATDRPQPDVTMVVPTYNERDHLGVLLEQLFSSCDRDGLTVSVIVVDDNSRDGTGLLADDWARGGRVQVIHRSGKLGLGSAVLEGFALATSDVVGVIDADLSHPPDLIPVLHRTLVGHDLDMVVASRYVGAGGIADWSLQRIVLSKLGCWLSRPLTPVRDAMSGFFLVRRDRVSRFRTASSGFKIGLEILVRANVRRVAEVDYMFVDREAGRSKMSLAECLRFLKQLVRLYRWSRATAAVQPSHLFVSAPLPRRQPQSVQRA
jgi:dolichol-phosphate mannosyltransferase